MILYPYLKLQIFKLDLQIILMQIPVDKIFYINLDKSHIRLKRLEDHFKRVPIKDKDGREPIRFPALSGNQATHSFISKNQSEQPGLPLSSGEKGCFASHRAIMQMQIENGWEYVMYLEDDVRFIRNNLNQLVTNWDSLPEFDFFNLSWRTYYHVIPQKIDEVDFPIKGLTKGNGMWLTHSYILSLHGAKKCEELTRIQSHSIDWHYASIQSFIHSIGFKYGSIAIQDNKGSGMKSTIIHS
jgi:GR25 family glycosyltransferase involved in LPS biosynthesis